MSLHNFSSQLYICPTCTPVSWAPVKLNPKMLHFWADSKCFSVCTTGTSLHLHRLPLGAVQTGLAPCIPTEPSSGKCLAEDSWEGVKCSLFPHCNSELTFCTYNFDVMSTKSKLQSSSEHRHLGISKTQISVLWKSENTFSWKKLSIFSLFSHPSVHTSDGKGLHITLYISFESQDWYYWGCFTQWWNWKLQ